MKRKVPKRKMARRILRRGKKAYLWAELKEKAKRLFSGEKEGARKESEETIPSSPISEIRTSEERMNEARLKRLDKISDLDVMKDVKETPLRNKSLRDKSGRFVKKTIPKDVTPADLVSKGPKKQPEKHIAIVPPKGQSRVPPRIKELQKLSRMGSEEAALKAVEVYKTDKETETKDEIIGKLKGGFETAREKIETARKKLTTVEKKVVKPIKDIDTEKLKKSATTVANVLGTAGDVARTGVTKGLSGISKFVTEAYGPERTDIARYGGYKKPYSYNSLIESREAFGNHYATANERGNKLREKHANLVQQLEPLINKEKKSKDDIEKIKELTETLNGIADRVNDLESVKEKCAKEMARIDTELDEMEYYYLRGMEMRRNSGIKKRIKDVSGEFLTVGEYGTNLKKSGISFPDIITTGISQPKLTSYENIRGTDILAPPVGNLSRAGVTVGPRILGAEAQSAKYAYYEKPNIGYSLSEVTSVARPNAVTPVTTLGVFTASEERMEPVVGGSRIGIKLRDVVNTINTSGSGTSIVTYKVRFPDLEKPIVKGVREEYVRRGGSSLMKIKLNKKSFISKMATINPLFGKKGVKKYGT